MRRFKVLASFICLFYFQNLTAQFIEPIDYSVSEGYEADLLLLNGKRVTGTFFGNEMDVSLEEDGFNITKDSTDTFVNVDSIKQAIFSNKSYKYVFERVDVDLKQGSKQPMNYVKQSMLLQLATFQDTSALKLYINPNFENAGLESAPVGEFDQDYYDESYNEEEMNRSFVDNLETSYYFKPRGMKAILIHKSDYLEKANYAFQQSSSFLKRYYLSKYVHPDSKKKAKRRKKSLKKRGKRSSKIQKLYWKDLKTQLEEFNKLRTYDIEKKQKLRAGQN